MKVGFISLGCPKNLVDSEVMMGQLKQKGYEITADAEEADTVVVNTCGFIDSAKKESIDTILEAARLKTEGKATRLVVAGCLVERYRDELKAEMPEVDAFIGTSQINDILAVCDPKTNTRSLPGDAARQSERDLSLRRIDAARARHAELITRSSRSPKAAIGRAPSVSFRRCAVIFAAVVLDRSSPKRISSPKKA